MAIPSKEYWARRSAERMIDYTAEAEKTANKIGKAYYNAGKYLSDEAGKVAKSFGKAFDLSEAEALRLMKNPPGKTMMQQLKAAVSGISDPEKRKELEAVISSPAYAYRIGRLEQVEKNIRDSCAKLYNTELKADESFFRSLPITAYERTIFDVQKAIGISSSFAQFPESRVNRILSTKWSGEHFSERVWANTNTLANGLQHDMLVGIMAGKSEIHMADDIMARMGGGAYAARRVVRTETNYIANQAELDGYKECGLEKYEFSAHLDNRTSEICAEIDGKVFDLKDAQAGTNLPPMHPFCRSSTVPVLPSEEELDRIIQQDGDAIGADVDFEEWKSRLVETEDGKLVYRKEDLSYMSNSFRPRYSNDIVDFKTGDISFSLKKVKNSQFDLWADTAETARSKAVKLAERNLKAVQNMIPDNIYSGIPKTAVIDFYKHGINSNAIAGYDRKTGIIYLNSKYDTKEKILAFVNKNNTFANKTEYAPILHELGHDFYEKSIKALAKSENIEYNIAKSKIDTAIYDYVHRQNSTGLFLSDNISEYADKGFANGKYTELVAECFSTYKENPVSKEIVDLLRR